MQFYAQTDASAAIAEIEAAIEATHTLAPVEDGWSVDKTGQVAYCLDHKPQFGLNYDEALKCISVLSHSYDWRVCQLGIQYASLLSLSQHSVIGFHGVTILCGDQVVILSAPSGTGKTTLANLLTEHTDGLVVNGDFALLHPIPGEGIVFEPTPFCGSSGIARNFRLRVNRIVFLEQGVGNSYRSLNPKEGYARLLSNCFVPEWDAERAAAVRETALQIVESVPMDCYAFEPTQEAAELFHSIVTKGLTTPPGLRPTSPCTGEARETGAASGSPV